MIASRTLLIPFSEDVHLIELEFILMTLFYLNLIFKALVSKSHVLKFKDFSVPVLRERCLFRPYFFV